MQQLNLARPERPSPEQLPEALTTRYTIVKAIGSGAMGIVYLARDNVLDTEVAIKMMHRDADAISVVRFQNEAIAAGKLKHPNIAQVLNFGNADGRIYMVMEYVPGESLSSILETHGRMPAEDALEIFLDIVKGVAFAHANKVIHRDLKPSNVILSVAPDGTPQCKIVDFGIAKLQTIDQQITGTGSYLGSPAYVSPEQARDLPVDGRTDIYSLGCLMYEVLVGHPPFQSETAIETINLKLCQPAPSLADSSGDKLFTSGLIALVDTCLATDPQDRFESMDKVQEMIEEMLQDQQENSGEPDHTGKSEESERLKHQAPRPTPLKSAILLSRQRMIVAAACIAFITGIILLVNMQPGLFFAMVPPAPNNNVVALSRKPPDPDKLSFTPDLPDERMLRKPKNYKAIEAMGKEIPSGFDLVQKAQDEDFALLRKIPKVTYLHVRAQDITGSGFETISDLPIEQLWLEGTLADGSCLKSIAKMPKLNSLFLKNNDSISEESLKYLYPLANRLKMIDIRSETLTNKTAGYLRQFLHLENVTLGNSCRVTDDSVERLVKLPHLSVLGLPHTGITASGVQLAATKSSLRSLDISGDRLNDEAVEALGGMMHLQQLCCLDCDLTPQQITCLAGNRQIGNLQIDARRIDQDAVRAIAAMPCLTLLCLQHVADNLDLSPLSKSQLSMIIIKQSEVRQEQLKPLLKMPNLQSVNLEDCDKIDKSYETIFCNDFERARKRPVSIDIHKTGLREFAL